MRALRSVFATVIAIAFIRTTVSAAKCSRVTGLTLEDMGNPKFVTHQIYCRQLCTNQKKAGCAFIRMPREGSGFRCHLLRVFSAAKADNPSHYLFFPRDFPQGTSFTVCDDREDIMILRKVKTSGPTSAPRWYPYRRELWPFFCHVSADGCFDGQANTCLATSADDNGVCTHYKSYFRELDACVCSP